MALPVLNVGSTNEISVTGGLSDSQIALPGGKIVFKVNSSAPVVIGIYGPFPGGTVDPSAKAGLGKLKICCVNNVQLGNNAVATAGNYLVEITQAPTATVELTVTPWSFIDNLLQLFWSKNQC